MASLIRQSYGKHRVRFSKIKRVLLGPPEGERHEFFEASVDVELEGDFEAAYTRGDTRLVVATDTCRNTIYVLAKDDPIDSLESFGLVIAKHFLNQYSHVSRVTVGLCQQLWDRMDDAPHGFTGTNHETPTVQLVATRSSNNEHAIELTSGIKNLVIAKTTQSGFSEFHRDEFRTLPDVDDRILATSMTASWVYAQSQTLDFAAARQAIRYRMMETFLDHYSRSVQETLYRMANAALEVCSAIESITLTMPNKHHIRFNLEPFGRRNENEVFVVTDEPFGYITATVGR